MPEKIRTRLRCNIKRVSVKDGYRPDITVEVDWSGDDLDDEEALYRFGSWLNELDKKAFEKANEMNLREGFPMVALGSSKREQESTNGGTRVHMGVDLETGEILDDQ
jgi:hypothetical protein